MRSADIPLYKHLRQDLKAGGFNLVASAGTAGVDGDSIYIGDRLGKLVVWLWRATINSGTAEDVTVKARLQGHKMEDQATPKWTEWITVGTYAAADIASGKAVHFPLENVSGTPFRWGKNVQFRLEGASGTYDVVFEGGLEGQ